MSPDEYLQVMDTLHAVRLSFCWHVFLWGSEDATITSQCLNWRGRLDQFSVTGESNWIFPLKAERETRFGRMRFWQRSRRCLSHYRHEQLVNSCGMQFSG